jgi:hypothetical protein
LLGALDESERGDSLFVLDDLAVFGASDGIGLVDIAQPAAPVSLPVDIDVIVLGSDVRRISGDRHVGVWLPAGELGARLVWRP